jgi:hypothetical protein
MNYTAMTGAISEVVLWQSCAVLTGNQPVSGKFDDERNPLKASA